MKKLIILFCLFSLSIQGFTQKDTIIKKKFYHGKFDNQDTSIGYTEAVLVDNILYLSGMDGSGTIPEELQSIYTDLQKILEAYGVTFHNVVKETLYTTDIEAVKKYDSIRKTYYEGDYPAATWIQISRLFSPPPGTQIEVELIAYLPKHKYKKRHLKT